MLKKTLIVFLALILFCGSAPASAERMTLDIGLQTETDAKHLTADLISADGKTFILSDLFPSYAVSFPFSSGFGFSDIRSAVISLIRLFRQDSSPARFEQLSFFNPVTEKGLYAGDLFDSATQLQTLTVNISDFISQVGKADHAGLLPLFDSVFDSPVSLVIRIYDSGKYLSVSGMKETFTLFTLSCDFSESGKKKIVWGYPENGQNYYWAAESTVLSEEEMVISCALYSDKWRRGFRDAAMNDPVLSEKWTFQMTGQDQMQIRAEITPASYPDPIVISCIVMDDISAEVQFGNSGQSSLSFSIREKTDEIKIDGYQQISIEDLLSPSKAAAFYAEIGANALPFYFYLMQILPQDFLNVLLNQD